MSTQQQHRNNHQGVPNYFPPAHINQPYYGNKTYYPGSVPGYPHQGTLNTTRATPKAG
jgi:hypothetical protein